MGSIVSFVICILLICSLQINGQNIDIGEIEKIFYEYDEICRIDNGNLWDISLKGPLMFVERESRTILSNTPDNDGILQKNGNVFIGKLPDEYGIANTTFNWNGIQWTMVLWPVPENRFERNQLIFHESFHSMQRRLGIELPNAENPHLETKEGRIYLQLEWLALTKALHNPQNNQFIQDALVFRNYRRSIFQGSDSTENILELLEGIPEYTGIKLSGRDSMEILEYLSDMIDTARKRDSYFRTFPYTSGPLYCFIIERKDMNWRKNIFDLDDLGEYLRRSCSVSLPENLKTEAEIRALKYDGTAIIRQEIRREMEIEEKKRNILNLYFHGPVLVIPIKKPEIEFSPLNMIAIDEEGTFFKTLRLVDIWGILEVEEGAFINKLWQEVRVSAAGLKITDNTISGNGWTLNLKSGWKLKEKEMKGNYKLLDQGN